MLLTVTATVENVERMMPRVAGDAQCVLLTLKEVGGTDGMKLVAPDEKWLLDLVLAANQATPRRALVFNLRSAFASLGDLTGGQYMGNVYRLTVSDVSEAPNGKAAAPTGRAAQPGGVQGHGEGVTSFEMRRRPR